jgi:uncharacterized membrane protein
MPAVLLIAAGMTVPAIAEDVVSDVEALAIVHKHCVACHAEKPAHPAFERPPKDIALETLAQLQRHTRLVYQQTVQDRAMPLGKQTGMTEAERAALGRWVKALP